MSILQAIILGLVQGLTEFIPVSSSGHLLIVHNLMGTTENTLSFDIALHVGTLLALLLYFRKDLWNLLINIFAKNKEGRLARLLILATIPAALIGFLLGDYVDEHVRSIGVVAVSLGVVGIIMLVVDKMAKDKKNSEVTTKQGLLIGFAQALALVPGVSRSGATMTTGLLVGLGREQAARFSFLLAVPIIAGSALGILVKNSDGLTLDLPLIVGMLTAFISGLGAIALLLNLIKRVGLKPFAYYRIILALIILAILV